METRESQKPGKLIPRLTAVLIFTIGAYIIVADLFELWRIFRIDDGFSIFIFLFTIVTFALGIYLIRLGIRVWSKITANIVRQISIITAINIDIFAFSFIPESFNASDHMIASATSMATAGVAYLVICKFLLKLFKVERTHISKGLKSFFNIYLIILSLDIIVLPMSFYETFIEEKKAIPGSIEPLVIFPFSIIVAIIFYKACMRYIDKNSEPIPDKEITPEIAQ